MARTVMQAVGGYHAIQPAPDATVPELGNERAGSSTPNLLPPEHFDIEMATDRVADPQQTRGEYVKAVVRNMYGLPTTVVTSAQNMYSRLPSFRALTAQLNRKHGIGFVILALVAGDRMAMGLNLASAQSQIRRLQLHDRCRTYQGNDQEQLAEYYDTINQVADMGSEKCDPSIGFFAMKASQTIEDMLEDQEQFAKHNCAEVARAPWMPHTVFDYVRSTKGQSTKQQKASWRKYALAHLSRNRHINEALKKVTPNGSRIDKFIDSQLAYIDSQLATLDAKPNPIVCKNHPDS